MKIQPYIEKLETSNQYKDFNQKYPDAFLVAGFFVLDFDTNQHVHQIDYYIPKEKKVAAFNLDGDVEVRILETMNDSIPEKLNIQTNIDLDALKGIVEDEMKNRNMTESVKKIIAVIQNLQGKKIWVVNCLLSGMELLKTHIEDESKTILSMEKSSVMDYIKKVPMQQQQQQGAEIKPSKEDIDAQIKQLDKIKEELEKEKKKLDEGDSKEKNKHK
jgi:hypothetical protein